MGWFILRTAFFAREFILFGAGSGQLYHNLKNTNYCCSFHKISVLTSDYQSFSLIHLHRHRQCTIPQLTVNFTFNQCCGSKYIEFRSGSRIFAQFGSGSRVTGKLLILRKKLALEKKKYISLKKNLFLNYIKIMAPVSEW